MEEDALATAIASSPPSYESVLLFLTSLAQWLNAVRERLACLGEVGRHAIAVDALARHYERTYGQLTESAWRHTTEVDAATTSLFPSASVELTAWILLRLLLLVFAWWMLLRLVLATTIPRLRARQIAGKPRTHWSLSFSDAHAAEAFIRPDAAQRRINATLLWTVGACGSVASLLILCLLTMHLWVDVVLSNLLQRWTAPLRRAQTWVSSRLWRSSSWLPGSLRAAVTLVGAHATSLSGVAAEWHTGSFSRFAWLRRVTRQVKMIYLWNMFGGAVLGMALWLLNYSAGLLRSYNASLPYFEENDPLLRWLTQQEAEDALQRTDTAFVALLEIQRRQERVVEKLKSSLELATPREQQRCLAMGEEGEGPQSVSGDTIPAAATSDATEDAEGEGEGAADRASAAMIGKGYGVDDKAGKSPEECGPSPDCVLATAFEEAAAATGQDGGVTNVTRCAAPLAQGIEGAAATTPQMEK
ncbi:hypothetical protein LSCM1_00238 [Leishmania martiniquensis]|uniref:Uncharacterized protein n=1 Tax=Leishmania martiniquensis TaxID=1580590 RepID=A0A836GHL7_9TRYP|nr:hypothetical protein LSCM1_00238 [Leishmania martiniquensis]